VTPHIARATKKGLVRLIDTAAASLKAFSPGAFEERRQLTVARSNDQGFLNESLADEGP